MYFHYTVGISVSQTMRVVCRGKRKEQQNQLTHWKGNPRVTVAGNIIGGKNPADQVAGLSYSSVFSFHSGKERTV